MASHSQRAGFLVDLTAGPSGARRGVAGGSKSRPTDPPERTTSDATLDQVGEWMHAVEAPDDRGDDASADQIPRAPELDRAEAFAPPYRRSPPQPFSRGRPARDRPDYPVVRIARTWRGKAISRAGRLPAIRPHPPGHELAFRPTAAGGAHY